MTIRYYEKKYETMDRSELSILQTQRLKKTLKQILSSNSSLKTRLIEHGIKNSYDIEKIRSTDILKNMPFTYKSDLVDNYPFGIFSQSLDKIVRIHASSGTTGKPIIAGYTKNDIKVWSKLMARVFCAAGISKNDIAQNAYGYGLFTGGLGFHYGAQELGMMIIPMSTGFTERQLTMMQDIGATVLFCTPSYALFLSEEINKKIADKSNIKLKKGIFGAEPWSDELRQKIELKNNPFERENVIRASKKEREQIVESKEPSIIIATSGMMQGGPIIDYFSYAAEDEKNLLAFVSYQAQGTLGRRLLEGEREIVINDRKINVKLRINRYEGFSGHADRFEILSFIKYLRPKPKQAFVVHGELPKPFELSENIYKRFGIFSYAPKIGDIIRLD